MKLAGLVLAIAASFAAAPAHAHPLALGVLVVRESPGGEIESSFRFSGTEARASGAELELPARCRPSGVAIERPLEEGGVMRVARAACGPDGLDGATIAVRGMEGTGVQIVARVERADGSAIDAVLDDETREIVVARGGSTLGRAVALGIEHIALGVDHLLFVLGLMLLVRGARPLVATITSFTIGHSVTLALATLGVLRVPGPPVEACIALSLLLVALELARERAAEGRSAMAMAAAFGLLHGLGFAGALAARGLPERAIVPTLLGFNAGVELGQLAFVAVVLAAIAIARRAGAPDLRAPVVHALGGIAVYLFLDRCVALGSP